MDSRRQRKISKLLQEVISEVVSVKRVELFGAKALATVTAVRVTADLGIARVYISLFNIEKPEEKIEECNNRVGEIRGEIGSRLRHNLRKIPELQFFLDDSMEQAQKIDEIFKSIEAERQQNQSES